MKIHTVYGFLLILFFIFSDAGNVLAEQNKVESAKLASSFWLRVVDQSKYEESWDTLATLFRKKVTRKGWEKELETMRVPLGKLTARKLIGAKYVMDLPDAPKGEYVVVQYESSFENRDKVLETVVPMLDIDGNWRVAGYFFKAMVQ